MNKQLFSGEFRHAMDDKNRVTVPAAWRIHTDGEVFFTIPHQTLDFLIVMPPAEFESVSEEVNNNPAISPNDRRVFLRQFYSRARQCVTDRQGRILLPEDQRLHAALKEEVVLVGAYARFEIWDPANWMSRSKNEESTYEQVSTLVGL